MKNISLPDSCYWYTLVGSKDFRIITIKNGDIGYRRIPGYMDDGRKFTTTKLAEERAMLLNRKFNIDQETAVAMVGKSMHGWGPRKSNLP